MINDWWAALHPNVMGRIIKNYDRNVMWQYPLSFLFAKSEFPSNTCVNSYIDIVRVMGDSWCVISNEWWAIVVEWWVMGDSSWVMSDSWWVMRGEWLWWVIAISDERNPIPWTCYRYFSVVDIERTNSNYEFDLLILVPQILPVCHIFYVHC